MSITFEPPSHFLAATRSTIVVCLSLAITCLNAPCVLAQNLVLFPNSSVSVADNSSSDNNPAIGIIEILPSNAVPVPDLSGNPTDIEFVGEINTNIVGPTNTQGGSVSVTITHIFGTVFGGWFTNNSSFQRQVGSTPFDRFDYGNMLEFVFVDYPPLFGPGTVSAEINADLGQLVGNELLDHANNATTDQQLRLGVSATTFIGNNSQDFAYAHATPDPPHPYNSVVPMSDGPNSQAGIYNGTSGTLQIHIDDALLLGGNDTIHMPNSIEIVITGSPIPEPTTCTLCLIAFSLAGAASRAKKPKQ